MPPATMAAIATHATIAGLPMPRSSSVLRACSSHSSSLGGDGKSILSMPGIDETE
jgi:hypothetical protein